MGLRGIPSRRLFYVSELPKTTVPGLKFAVKISSDCLRGDRKCPPGDEGGPSRSPEAEVVIIAKEGFQARASSLHRGDATAMIKIT